MDRLTHRYIGGKAYVNMDHVSKCGEYECGGPAIERLAAYEDTGLEPEEIKDSELKIAALLSGSAKRRHCQEAIKMLTVTIEVDAPAGLSLAVKEQLAMLLEQYGDTKVVSVVTMEDEQWRSTGTTMGRC